MRALSVRQPWASLIATGEKSVEIRTWSTSYRGPLLIVSSLAPSRSAEAQRHDVPARLPEGDALSLHGRALALVTLYDVRPAERTDAHLCGGFDPTSDVRALAWVLTDPRPFLGPMLKGRLGLWTPDDDTKRSVRAHVANYTRRCSAMLTLEWVQVQVHEIRELLSEMPPRTTSKGEAEYRARLTLANEREATLKSAIVHAIAYGDADLSHVRACCLEACMATSPYARDDIRRGFFQRLAAAREKEQTT